MNKVAHESSPEEFRLKQNSKSSDSSSSIDNLEHENETIQDAITKFTSIMDMVKELRDRERFDSLIPHSFSFDSKSNKVDSMVPKKVRRKSDRHMMKPTLPAKVEITGTSTKVKLRHLTMYQRSKKVIESESWDDKTLDEYLNHYKLSRFRDVFFKKNNEKTLESTVFEVEKDKRTLEIIHAPVDYLIELLLIPENSPIKAFWSYDLFIYQFLLVFPTFVTPLEFFNQLVKKWNSLSRSVDCYDYSIRVSILKILKEWISLTCSLDFYNNGLVRKVDEFFESNYDGEHDRQIRTLQSILETYHCHSSHFVDPPPSILPDKTDFIFMDVSPIEMARQLTILESNLFSNLKREELLDHRGWNNPDKYKTAPNIVLAIQHSNKITNWVSSEILRFSTSKLRADAIEYFVLVLQQLHQLNNFNSMIQILSSIHSAAIYTKLKETWRILAKREKVKEMLDGYTKLMDTASHYKTYRDALSQIQQDTPCIPLLSVVCQDLFNIQDATNTMSETMPEWINWQKMSVIANRIADGLRLDAETTRYSLQPVTSIQNIFLNSEEWNQDVSYQVAAIRETHAEMEVSFPAEYCQTSTFWAKYSMTPNLWKFVLSVGTLFKYEPDDVILSEGTINHSLFKVQLGRVKIMQADTIVSRLGEGQIFGQVSALSRTKSSASCVAITPVTIYQINIASLKSVLQRSHDVPPELPISLYLYLARYLSIILIRIPKPPNQPLDAIHLTFFDMSLLNNTPMPTPLTEDSISSPTSSSSSGIVRKKSSFLLKKKKDELMDSPHSTSSGPVTSESEGSISPKKEQVGWLEFFRDIDKDNGPPSPNPRIDINLTPNSNNNDGGSSGGIDDRQQLFLSKSNRVTNKSDIDVPIPQTRSKTVGEGSPPKITLRERRSRSIHDHNNSNNSSNSNNNNRSSQLILSFSEDNNGKSSSSGKIDSLVTSRSEVKLKSGRTVLRIKSTGGTQKTRHGRSKTAESEKQGGVKVSNKRPSNPNSPLTTRALQKSQEGLLRKRSKSDPEAPVLDNTSPPPEKASETIEHHTVTNLSNNSKFIKSPSGANLNHKKTTKTTPQHKSKESSTSTPTPLLDTKTFTIYYPPNDKKRIILNPIQTLETVVQKICELRDYKMNDYVAVDKHDSEIPYSTLLGNIDGGFVNLVLKASRSKPESESMLLSSTHQGKISPDEGRKGNKKSSTWKFLSLRNNSPSHSGPSSPSTTPSQSNLNLTSTVQTPTGSGGGGAGIGGSNGSSGGNGGNDSDTPHVVNVNNGDDSDLVVKRMPSTSQVQFSLFQLEGETPSAEWSCSLRRLNGKTVNIPISLFPSRNFISFANVGTPTKTKESISYDEILELTIDKHASKITLTSTFQRTFVLGSFTSSTAKEAYQFMYDTWQHRTINTDNFFDEFLAPGPPRNWGSPTHDSSDTSSFWDIILKGGVITKHKTDSVILKQGQKSRKLFILTAGECIVKREDVPHPLCKIQPQIDNVFGEISYTLDTEASASVIASQDNTTVCAVDAFYINILATYYPKVIGRLFQYVAELLARRVASREKVWKEDIEKAAANLRSDRFNNNNNNNSNSTNNSSNNKNKSNSMSIPLLDEKTEESTESSSASIPALPSLTTTPSITTT
eukprot:TRINITY_DN6861_c1_g1_i2.p1 TRINITY_DN6861_c1_g1~~TRINITY_DN6861_c1_g1_i2.p1  ORF type:complete len:1619 (-),score=357.53 TRINITY_DN6861_c1_g1_i2:49-4905(-)